MTSVEQFNALDGKTVSRATLEELAALGKDQGQMQVYEKLTSVLNSHDDKSFKINITQPISGLNAPRHSGTAKVALDDCGRLKKGYKYKAGKIVKIATRKKSKPVRKTKPVAKSRNTAKEKLRAKVLGLQSLISKDLPEISVGLNGAFLADGHQILDEDELDQYGPEEWEGLNAAAKDVEAIVNELILEKIKTGEDLPPWKQSWANKADIPAQNYVTKKPYTGSNSTILNVLLGSVMPTPYYITFNQVKDLGGKVKEGAKSVPLVYYNFVHTLKNLSDNPGKEAELLRKITGRMIKRRKPKKDIILSKGNYAGVSISEKDIKFLGLDSDEYISKGFLRYYRVFNIADTTGIEYEVPKGQRKTKKEKIVIAEAIIKAFSDKPPFLKDNDKAYYKPKEDKIWIPEIHSFDTPEEYYSTLFHELIHCTLHESRVNRQKDYDKKESKAQYAFEELIAELGASYLCGLAGILEVTHINQASYLKGWYEKLVKLTDSNTDFFIYATREAQKAVDYIIRDYVPGKETLPKKGKYDDKTKALAKAKALKLKLKLKLKHQS